MRFNAAWIPAAAAVALFIGCESKPVDKIPTAPPTAIKEPHEILPHLQYAAVRKDMKHLALLDPVDPMATDGAAYWFNSHSGDTGLALTAEEIKQFGLEDMQAKGFIATVARVDLQRKIDELSAMPLPPKGAKEPAPSLPAEMAGLDVSRLDFPQTIPGPVFAKEVKPFIEQHRRALYQAGLWRLLRGVPTELWGNIRVLETRKDPSNQRAFGVFLGLSGTGIPEADGKPIIDLALFKKEDNTWGLSYWQYKKQPKWLGKVVEAMKQTEAQK